MVLFSRFSFLYFSQASLPDSGILLTVDRRQHSFALPEKLGHGVFGLETGRDVVVTFNLRFHPFFRRVKEILFSGAIGKILSVHYEWL